MNTATQMIRRLGEPLILFVLLVPLVVTVAVGLLAPRIVAANQQATALVPVGTVSGATASYDAATYAGNFQAAYVSGAAVNAAAEASGLPASTAAALLTSTHPGNSTNVPVTFTADSAVHAEKGLRAAAKTALSQLATDQRTRAEIELEGASIQREAALLAVRNAPAPRGVDQAAWTESQQSLATQAATSVSAAQSRIAIANASLSAVTSIVADMPVEVSALSTTTDVIRMVATAGATSLLASLAIAWLLLRRRTRPVITAQASSSSATDRSPRSAETTGPPPHQGRPRASEPGSLASTPEAIE